MRILRVIKNLLLIFVFISIGFALGKSGAKQSGIGIDREDKGKYVHVYYLHGTVRCLSCNKIEKMTKELLETKFGREMKDGKLKFSEVNFQEDIGLAKLFDVLSSCVVVAKENSTSIMAHKRLDEVWTLKDKPAEFNDYISRTVSAFLAGTGDSE